MQWGKKKFWTHLHFHFLCNFVKFGFLQNFTGSHREQLHPCQTGVIKNRSQSRVQRIHTLWKMMVWWSEPLSPPRPGVLYNSEFYKSFVKIGFIQNSPWGTLRVAGSVKKFMSYLAPSMPWRMVVFLWQSKNISGVPTGPKWLPLNLWIIQNFV